MKKYNTPEMNVSMFNCETVATSEPTASEYAQNAVDGGTAAVRFYKWSDLVEAGITTSF